ncbi:MAG TPA: hypothetical protein VFF52_09775 [Isosphaeraceae bacterium]|nr:hypothetical protein [Isosphaeraceae bacterium]
MVRRCRAPLTMLVAVLALGLGWQPMSTRADSLTNNSNTANTATVTVDYTLTSSSAIPAPAGSKPAPGAANPPAPQITAVVNPVGVVPPPGGSVTGPLTILPGSSGFDPQNLAVYLGNFPSDPNATITSQALGLSFYGQGLAAGGVLNFALTIDKSLENMPPQLVVDSSQNPGVSIKLDGVENSSPPPSTPSSPAPETSAAKVPEPLSMLVWSILGLATMWRTRPGGPGRGRRRASRSGPCSVVRGR